MPWRRGAAGSPSLDAAVCALHLGEHRAVVERIDHDGDAVVVLRRRRAPSPGRRCRCSRRRPRTCSRACAIVAANGYRLTTTRSIASMPCSRMTASSVPRRPSRPPWIFGCSVLTRPSMISGKPVTADTSIASMPSPRSSLAVPPVEMICTPRRASSCANSSRPSLLETLISARWIGGFTGRQPAMP